MSKQVEPAPNRVLRPGPLPVVRVPRHWVHHRDLFHREVGDDLDAVLVDDEPSLIVPLTAPEAADASVLGRKPRISRTSSKPAFQSRMVFASTPRRTACKFARSVWASPGN
jgi:hypothetical protein